MSAWVVSKNHIDVLVQAALDAGLDYGDPTALGRQLWGENVKSVAARYGDGDLPGHSADIDAYTFTAPAKLSSTAIRKQVDCYDYQSCEHDDYERSFAYGVVQSLVAFYPVTSKRAYEAAKWGV